jgi:hypothetical protein
MMHLASVNWIAILAAAVAGWLFGALWYGLLSKPWMAAVGRTEAEIKAQSPVLPMVIGFVATLIMAFVLQGVIHHVGNPSIRAGIISGVLCWLGFVVTTMATNHAFGGKGVMLTVIDGGHYLGVLVIMGAILGWFGLR